jgi:hypothetical protein
MSLLAVLMIVGWCLWVVGRRGSWLSDPGIVRDADKLEELLRSAASPPVLNSSLLEDLEITRTNDSEVKISLPNASQPSGDPMRGHTVHQFDSDEPLVLEEGEVWLDYVGVAYGAFTGKSGDYSVSLPGRFFDGSLREIPEEAVQRRFSRWERDLDYRGQFPRARFGLKTADIGKVKLLKASVFDARTFKSLCNGYSSGVQNGVAYVETDVQLWHQAPLLLVFDIAHDPIDRTPLPPDLGTTIEHDWGMLQLVSVNEGASISSGSRSVGNHSVITLRFDPQDHQSETAFTFVGSPSAYPVPLDILFLDADGKQLPGAGGSSSGFTKTESTRASRSEVASLQVRQYTQSKRLVIRLPELPGLPEENRGVKNLFDVRIPHCRVRREYELRALVGDLVQMDVTSPSTRSPSPLVFPRSYTNTTPRDLLDDWRRFLLPGTRLKVDSQKNLIRTEPPPWRKWLDELKRFF